MSYSLMAYDADKSSFYSHQGKESGVSLQPEDKCIYFISTDRSIIVKLREGWFSERESIGEILQVDGTLISKIPHPGRGLGKLGTSGLESGDNTGFRMVVKNYGNEPSYYLWYDIKTQKFKGAGNFVR